MSNEDHEKNRVAWNEMVEVHWDHPAQKRKEFLDGRCSLKPMELEAFGDVNGKSLLHLMCQFGLDTLSWARRGTTVTGIDISDQSIKRADELNKLAGLEGRFLRSDVLDAIGLIDEKFDYVIQTYGTQCWISDMEKWAQVVAHYLKPGGQFFMADDHPIICLWETPPNPYIHKEPIRYSGEPDYCDRDHVIETERVEFQHPLSQIVNAIIKAGLTIEHLGEYDKGYYPIEADWVEKDRYWYPPDGSPMYPLMFSLKARKPE
jgi:SAM-dependent methyltransferase